MPATPIPTTGIAILDGNSRSDRALFCLWPGDEDVKTSDGLLGADAAPEGEDPEKKRRNKFIAAQCCVPPADEGEGEGEGEWDWPPWWPWPPGDKEACRRRALDSGEPSSDDDDCIAGVFSRNSEKNTFVPMTYGEALSACEDKGLALCDQSCRNTGCSYNNHPVYSALPCPFPA